MSDDDQSLPSVELRSLRRNSTIESGRQPEAMAKEPRRRGALSRKLGFFVGRTNSHHDAIQELFASTISEIENARTTHQAPDLQHLRRLSKEYRKFKERPALLCHHLFSYWNFTPAAQDAVATSKCEDFRGLLEENGSVSAWMCRIASILGGEARDGTQLIALAEEPGSEDLPSFFSFTHFTQATIMGNLKSIHSEPVWVLLFVVSVTWGIDLQPWATGFDTQDAHEIARPMPLMLPSSRSARKVTSGASQQIRWGSTSRKEGNLDSNRGDNEIFLSWLRSVTSFKRDLNVYIWEPHTMFPSTEYAKVILCPPQDEEGPMRLLISLRSCRLLEAYTDRRDAYSAEETVPALGETESQSWSNALLSVLCVLEVLVSDTDEFLRTYHKESARMRVLSRRNPTISKSRFMMHLEDSRKVASDGVKHATSVLPKLTAWAEKNIQETNEARAALLHTDKVAALYEDLEFCGRELERLRSYTAADYETLRQHFQLSQEMTLFRLTILAAIFLPLSFTTSFFGMNMMTGEAGPETFSNVTNDMLDNITDTNMRSSAEVLVSIVASSGNLNYEWKVFAGTAIGLLLILPFTLAVGTIMRTTVVSVVRYVKYWRALALLIGGVLLLAVMAFSILGVFLPRAIESNHLDTVYSDYQFTGYFGPWRERSNGWMMDVDRSMKFLVYGYLATNGLLLLMLVFLVYQSWSEGNERFFWTTQILVTATCFTVDILEEEVEVENFPFMVIPWVWLGLFNAWARRRWWKAWYARWR